MRVRKLLATILIVGVLGAQLAAIVPPGRQKGWYWPFLDYPMYATARHPGDTYDEQALRARGCGARSDTLGVDAGVLGVSPFLYRWLLSDLRSPQRSDTVQIIARLARERLPARYCVLELWETKTGIGPAVRLRPSRMLLGQLQFRDSNETPQRARPSGF